MNAAESELLQRTSGGRLLELDSLRGIAAFVVLFWHLRYAFYMDQPRWFLRPFVDGHSAVVLFFALSGYVLAISFWKGNPPSYLKYITRRFFRIYVPYIAALCLALVVGYPLLYSKLPLTPWFYETWHSPFTPKIIIKQFLLLSIDPSINTAFWSLRYEVIMSILFPAVCWTIKRLGIVGSLFFAMFLMFAGNGLIDYQAWSSHKSELGRVLMWSSPFILGALLALKRSELQSIYDQHPRGRLLVLALVTIGYFSFSDLAIIPSASILVIFAQQGIFRRLLQSPVPEFLGEISYSLYLVHGTVLFTALILLYGRISLWLLSLLYVGTSLVLATAFFHIVEKPAMSMGRRVTK